METAYDGRQILGMDLHRRGSMLARMTEDGRSRPAHPSPDGDDLRKDVDHAEELGSLAE